MNTGLVLIERVIYLNMATTNSTKLLKNIEGALTSGGVEAAKEVCKLLAPSYSLDVINFPSLLTREYFGI